MLRVGLVGFGLGGRVFHGPLLSSVEGIELASVLERSSNIAAQRYPQIRTCRSLEEMLSDKSLNLLVVSTPSATHFELARTILSAGRNVVVDKPLSMSSGQIAELMTLAQEKGLLLAPFHNRRWDGDFLSVKKLLADGTIGRLVYYESRFDRWRPNAPTDRLWKEDPAAGGVLIDLGTHLADQTLVLFGKPLAVSADIQCERDWTRASDSFEIRLRYEGFRTVLGANSLSMLAGPRFHLRGTKGAFWKPGLDPQEQALNKVTKIEDPKWGTDSENSFGLLYVDSDGGTVTKPVETLPGDYREYYKSMRDAVLRKAEAPVNAVEAWRVARLLEWAEESSASRREVVCDWRDEPR